jgi:glycosyltransferase involved in cell wall biosynthesis
MHGQFDGRGQWDAAAERATALASASAPAKLLARPHGRSPESTWTGHVYDQSGYAKMTRELLFRVSNSVRVSLLQGVVCEVPTRVDALTQARLDAHLSIKVSPDAPFVMIHTPLLKRENKNHVCYTMMETQRIHKEFIDRLNNLYDEVWFPTAWNLDVAKGSGLKIPGKVMTLGVDPLTFKPMERKPLPKVKLLTTKRSGVFENPKGFVFVFCGFPTFRKGMDVLLNAFEDAFHGDPDAALVLLTTYTRISRPNYDPWKPGPEPESRRTRVYEMTGVFTDHELADAYNGCDCYVCASRGEGWNMPLTEAASCGLPVIAPFAYSHMEFLTGDKSFVFPPDGYAPIKGSENISHWYEGMSFADYGKKAHDNLVDLLRFVKKNPDAAKEKADRLSRTLRTRHTWDLCARRVAERLMELQP